MYRLRLFNPGILSVDDLLHPGPEGAAGFGDQSLVDGPGPSHDRVDVEGRNIV